MIKSDSEIATATNAELAETLQGECDDYLRREIQHEIKARNEQVRLRPFDVRIDVSADAKYLWKRIFIWFWIVPVVLAVLIYLSKL